MMQQDRPPQRRDETGQCMHLYLTRDATCVHCGMQFGLAWEADRAWVTRPTLRNIVIGLAGSALYLGAQTIGGGLLASAALVVLVLFFTRAVLGGLEIFAGHRFMTGALGKLVARHPLNVLSPKRYYAELGRAKVPMDNEVYRRFAPGDTLLVEHLRWSRLPVAIYRGHSG